MRKERRKIATGTLTSSKRTRAEKKAIVDCNSVNHFKKEERRRRRSFRHGHGKKKPSRGTGGVQRPSCDDPVPGVPLLDAESLKFAFLVPRGGERGLPSFF